MAWHRSDTIRDMYFTVLGRVGLSVGGSDVAIPRAQRRAVLAYLLLHAGIPVTIDRMVHALWGAQPPASAKTQIHNSVSSIRSLLRGAGRDSVSTTTAGYVLSADADVLDLAAFRGRVTRAAGDLPLHRKAELLRSALGLWRPPPLGGVSGEFVAPARAALVDEQLAAAERLFDVELELGRHHDVVTELAALCDAHPHRERLIGQLMIALHRCGRQAEALGLFRATRAVLVDEFGIEPSAELQEIHRSLLDNAAGRHARVAPNQLPAMLSTFVGRVEQLEAVAKQLAGSATLVTICGLGGLGKTSLAVKAAELAAPDYPDGCLFIDLRGTDRQPPQPHAVLAGFLRAMGVPAVDVPHDPAERLGLYRTVTSGRRMLVVLDNAQGEAQLRPLLPGGRGNAAIITSRRTLPALDGAHHLDLPLFSVDEGVDLVRSVLGDRWPAPHDPDLRRLLDVCAGLPLAVRVVAGRLLDDRSLTPAELAGALENVATSMAELATGDLAVASSLQLSATSLTPGAFALLSHLGRTSQPDHTRWSAHALLGEPADAALTELAETHLVATDGERVGLHDLVRSYAAALSATDEGLHRLVNAYLYTAYHAAALQSAGRSLTHLTLDVQSPFGLRFDTRAGAIVWLDTECANIVAMIRQAASLGWHTEAWQLAYHLRFFFRATYRIDEWTQTHQVALDAAIALDDPLAETRIRESISARLGLQQRHDEQIDQLQTVQALCTRIGDRVGLARCHDSIGAALGSQGHLERAITHHRSALDIIEYAEDPQNEAIARINIGACLGKLDRITEAITEFEHVLRVAVAASDTQVICFVHHNLASSYLRLGDFRTAQVHARGEIVTAQKAGDINREARGWEMLGDALANDDQHGASKAWRQAIECYEAQGNLKLADTLRSRTSMQR